MHPGCTVGICAKFINEAFSNKIVSVSQLTLVHAIQRPNWLSLEDPISAGEGVCLVDNFTAKKFLHSFSPDKNMMIVIYNLDGIPQFAKLANLFDWSATASVAFYADFRAKIQKASVLQGLRVLEVLTPCPVDWKADPSNTIELARQAVESAIWPLYEIENKKLMISYKPVKIESPDIWFSMQKRHVEIDKTSLEYKWKKVLEGKIVEL